MIHIGHWSRYCCRWCSTLIKNIPLWLNFLFYLTLCWWHNNNWVAYSVLSYVLCSNKLWMPIVNYLINNFINEYKVFTNTFFIEHTAIVSENLHHSVYNIHNKWWRNIILSRSHKVYAKFFGKEVIQALYVL